MSKARASTQETMEFTLEPKEAGEGKKRKERVKKTMARVIGRSSMIRDSDEEEEEQDAPPVKTQNLMGDAIKSGVAPSKPKTAPRLLLLLKLLSLQHPRDQLGTYQLLRRTRPQCLKLKKKMPKCSEN